MVIVTVVACFFIRLKSTGNRIVKFYLKMKIKELIGLRITSRVRLIQHLQQMKWAIVTRFSRSWRGPKLVSDVFGFACVSITLSLPLVAWWEWNRFVVIWHELCKWMRLLNANFVLYASSWKSEQKKSIMIRVVQAGKWNFERGHKR